MATRRQAAPQHADGKRKKTDNLGGVAGLKSKNTGASARRTAADRSAANSISGRFQAAANRYAANSKAGRFQAIADRYAASSAAGRFRASANRHTANSDRQTPKENIGDPSRSEGQGGVAQRFIQPSGRLVDDQTPVQRVPKPHRDGHYIDPDLPDIRLKLLATTPDGNFMKFRVGETGPDVWYREGVGYARSGGGPLQPRDILAIISPPTGEQDPVAEQASTNSPQEGPMKRIKHEGEAEAPTAPDPFLRLHPELLRYIALFVGGLNDLMGFRLADDAHSLVKLRLLARYWNNAVARAAPNLGLQALGVLQIERQIGERHEVGAPDSRDVQARSPLSEREILGLQYLSDEILSSFALDYSLFLSIGNSPALVLEYMRVSEGAQVLHLPMSNVSGLESLEGENRKNFFNYIEKTLGPSLKNTKRDVVIVDIVSSGAGLASAGILVWHYLKQFGKPNISMLALNEKVKKFRPEVEEEGGEDLFAHLPRDNIEFLDEGGRYRSMVQQGILACRYKNMLLLKMFETHDFGRILRGALVRGELSVAHYAWLLKVINTARRINEQAENE